MSFVFGLVVGRVEIVDAADEACVHDSEVLIGQGHVDYEIGFVAAEEFDEPVNAVGVDGVGRDVGLSDSFGHGVAFAACARCDYDFVENFGVLSALVGDDGADAAATDDDNFIHVFYVFSFYLML